MPYPVTTNLLSRGYFDNSLSAAPWELRNWLITTTTTWPLAAAEKTWITDPAPGGKYRAGAASTVVPAAGSWGGYAFVHPLPAEYDPARPATVSVSGVFQGSTATWTVAIVPVAGTRPVMPRTALPAGPSLPGENTVVQRVLSGTLTAYAPTFPVQEMDERGTTTTTITASQVTGHALVAYSNTFSGVAPSAHALVWAHVQQDPAPVEEPPTEDEEPVEEPPATNTASELVAAFLGRPGDPKVLTLAAVHYPIMAEYVRGYTNGRGFDVFDQPTPGVAAVLVTATARSVMNPENLSYFTMGDYSERPATTAGWTLHELGVLRRHRRLTNREG